MPDASGPAALPQATRRTREWKRVSPLLRRVHRIAPGLRLRVIASGVPSAEMLREGPCQLVISPRPPDASDILPTR